MSLLSGMIYYNKFMNKYKKRISDVPSLNIVAKHYVVNRKDFNFSDWTQGYAFMTSLEEDKDFEFPCGDIYNDLPKNDTIFTDYTNKSFVQFNNRNKRVVPNEEQCKLWIDTSLKNVGEVSLLLAKFIDEADKKASSKNKHMTTFFKVSRQKKRNDTITIYTNYREADLIVEFLVKLRQKRPELFVGEVIANPLVMKIDDFISFADVAHCVSFPTAIADMLAYVDEKICANKDEEFDKLSTREQINYTKSLMIEYLLHMLKLGTCKEDVLVNLNNLGIRHINGRCASQLNKREISALSKNLRREQQKYMQDVELSL